MGLRGSSYNIAVKLTDEESLLVHGYTGAVRKVTAGTLSYIRSLDNRILRDTVICSVPPEYLIKELKRDGFITTMTSEEERLFIAQISRNLHRRRLKAKPEYMIIPTYSCNFDCFYCFEKDMRSCNGDDLINRVISRGMCDRICETFEKIERDRPPSKHDGDNPIHVTFYGGEPLQRVTKDVVLYLLEKLIIKNAYTFSAITNGYDLEFFEEMLAPDKLSKLQVTLDGIPEVHNARRTLKNSDEGTFAKIADNISLALDCGVEVNVRINTDRDTIIQFDKLTDEINRRGWSRYANFRATLAPVFCLKKEPGYEKCMNYGELLKEIKNYTKPLSGTAASKICVSMEDSFNSMKERIKNCKPLTPHFKSSICNSMGTLLIFDPYGDVYPCFEKVGKPASVIGNICEDNTLALNEHVHGMWRGRISTSNPSCGRCSYALFCGGGCASRAEERNGTIYSSYCDGYPAFFQAKVRELYLGDE